MNENLFYCFEKYKECNDIAIYYKNNNITYADFCENILKLATFLERLGIKKGDIVTLVLPNIPQCVYSLYAINILDAVVNILHPLTKFNNIIEKMNILNSKYVILMETLYQDNINFITDEECDKFFIFVNPVSEDGFLKSFFFHFKYKKPKISHNVTLFDLYKHCDKKYINYNEKNNIEIKNIFNEEIIEDEYKREREDIKEGYIKENENKNNENNENNEYKDIIKDIEDDDYDFRKDFKHFKFDDFYEKDNNEINLNDNNKNFLKDKYLDESSNNEVKEDYNKISENTSIIIHSGGTTGEPKIIELSNEAINNIAKNLNLEIMKEGIKNKSLLSVLPIFHCYGLCVGVHGFLYNHGSIYLMYKFDVDEVINGINKNKINTIIGIPSMFKKILEHPKFKDCNIKNMHECFMGADMSNLDLIRRFNEFTIGKDTNLLLCEGYGLSETCSVISVNTAKNYKIGSVGKPFKTIDIKIIDEDGNELSYNKVGEIYIAGNTLMNRYFKDKQGTEETFTTIDGVRYIKSGDIGYLDKDGFLFIKGRKKRVYKISGVSIYPKDVENIALSFTRYIKEASLEYFGIPKPHMILYLIKNEKIDISDEELVKKISNEIKEKTIKYNWPEKIIFLDNFPKTKLGKIDHNKLTNK